MHHFDATLRVETIAAGKLRRYHSIPLWQQLLRPDIVGPNLRDIFKIITGFTQSIVKLIIWRPDVVFTKGGFVCLPVGLAARLLRTPLVIHDSDAHPGLTNRVLGRVAQKIATGAPLKYYSYPAEKSQYVGIPVSVDHHTYGPAHRKMKKQELGFSTDRPLVLITGGGLGARRINDAATQVLAELLKTTNLLLVSGSAQYDELAALTPHDTDQEHFQLKPFVTPLVNAMVAADVVVTRAGATTMAELAATARPTILVPNGYLTGGHQLKNAAVYAEKDAVEVIDEHALDDNPQLLLHAVNGLLADSARQQVLSSAINSFAKPGAAEDMARLIIDAARRR